MNSDDPVESYDTQVSSVQKKKPLYKPHLHLVIPFLTKKNNRELAAARLQVGSVKIFRVIQSTQSTGRSVLNFTVHNDETAYITTRLSLTSPALVEAQSLHVLSVTRQTPRSYAQKRTTLMIHHAVHHRKRRANVPRLAPCYLNLESIRTGQHASKHSTPLVYEDHQQRTYLQLQIGAARSTE